LSSYARDFRAEYDSNVGYIFGRGHGCVFAIPPVRLFSVSRALEHKVAKDGLSGYNHVSSITAYTRLDRSRDRDAAQRSIRSQLNMGQRPEPFSRKIVAPTRILTLAFHLSLRHIVFNRSKCTLIAKETFEQVILFNNLHRSYRSLGSLQYRQGTSKSKCQEVVFLFDRDGRHHLDHDLKRLGRSV